MLENLSLADNKGRSYGLSRGVNKKRIDFYRQQLSALGLGLEDKLDVRMGALSVSYTHLGICKGCGVATLTISYYDIGYATGEMAYEILVNGADPAEMEIQYAPQFTPKYNPDMCDAFGLTPPDGYEAIEPAA